MPYACAESANLACREAGGGVGAGTTFNKTNPLYFPKLRTGNLKLKTTSHETT